MLIRKYHVDLLIMLIRYYLIRVPHAFASFSSELLPYKIFDDS